MQQLWPCIIRYLNSACGMPQHPLYWLNFHPTHRKEEGGEAGVGDVTNRQLALKIKSFSCLTRSRTCMERAGYMCEYSVRNTIQQASPYPDSRPKPQPQPQPHLQLLQLQSQSQARRKPQSQSRPRFHVHAAFSFPSLPFPLSLWFPVAFCPPHSPSIAISCSWVSISLLGRVISSHIASSVSQYLSQRIYLACCLCICITLQKKTRI